MWRAWLCLLDGLPTGTRVCCQVPLKPSLLQAGQAQLPQPLLAGPVLQPHYLGDLPDHLSNVFLVPGSPKLGAGFSHSLMTDE